MTSLAKYDAIPAISSPGLFPPGNLGQPFPEPAQTQGVEPFFSSVPAVAVPGRFTIGGFTGPAGPSYYLYAGHLVLYYLDYLNPALDQTLVAHPGQIYTMLPVNSRAGLTIPPPDGRWGVSPPALSFQVVFRPRQQAQRELAPVPDLRHFSPMPGLCIPGQVTAGGFTGPAGHTYYRYTGQQSLSYLGHLNPLAGGTLHAHPGNIYSLPAAPADPWRWGAPAPEPAPPPEPPRREDPPPPAEVLALDALFEAADMLTRARIRNANLQALAARGG